MGTFRRFGATKHTAIKTHECNMCGAEIKPGMFYQNRTFFQAGRYVNIKVHVNPSCKEVDNAE